MGRQPTPTTHLVAKTTVGRDGVLRHHCGIILFPAGCGTHLTNIAELDMPAPVLQAPHTTYDETVRPYSTRRAADIPAPQLRQLRMRSKAPHPVMDQQSMIYTSDESADSLSVESSQQLKIRYDVAINDSFICLDATSMRVSEPTGLPISCARTPCMLTEPELRCVQREAAHNMAWHSTIISTRMITHMTLIELIEPELRVSRVRPLVTCHDMLCAHQAWITFEVHDCECTRLCSISAEPIDTGETCTVSPSLTDVMSERRLSAGASAMAVRASTMNRRSLLGSGAIECVRTVQLAPPLSLGGVPMLDKTTLLARITFTSRTYGRNGLRGFGSCDLGPSLTLVGFPSPRTW